MNRWPGEGDSVVILDLETRSPVDIRKRGGYIYASDSRTHLLCGCAVRLWGAGPPELYIWSALPDQFDARAVLRNERVVDLINRCGLQRAKVATGNGAAPDRLLDLANVDVPFVAHNAWGFDQHVARRIGLGSANWIDTLPLARALGLPPGLDDLGRELLGLGKDKEGRRIMLKLCKPSGRTGQYIPPSAGDMELLIRYCLIDTLVLTYAWLSQFASREPEPVYWVDRDVNSYGVAVDLPLIDDLLWVAAEAGARDLRQIAQETAGRVDAALLRSPKKLRTWTAEQGIELVDCKAATIEQALVEREIPPHVRRVLRARIGANRVGEKKLTALRAWADGHGIVRYTLALHGTFTGRWAGRGPQPQNLPRPVGVPEDVLDAALALPRGDARAILALCDEREVKPADLVSDLVRQCIIPDEGDRLLVMDFASIEGRVLAWVAGNGEALAQYAAGVDLYKVMAARIFGLAEDAVDAVTKEMRAVGKVAVLACGYQMGVGRFEETAAAFGVDLAAAGTSAGAVVSAWRSTHPDECRLWRHLQQGVAALVCEGEGSLTQGRCRWVLRGPHLVCVLPSGREMIYRDAALEKDGRITYDWAGSRRDTYGGKLTENVVSAIARDCLAHAMVALAAAGYQICLHVHDEVVIALGPEDDPERAQALMEASAPWAEAVPLAVDAFVAPRYRK